MRYRERRPCVVMKGDEIRSKNARFALRQLGRCATPTLLVSESEYGCTTEVLPAFHDDCCVAVGVYVRFFRFHCRKRTPRGFTVDALRTKLL